MPDAKLIELRQQIEKTPRNRRGYRQYSDGLRRDGIRYVKTRLSQGARVEHVAEALGLNQTTLQTWLKMTRTRAPGSRSTEQPKRSSSSTLRPVQVVAAQPGPKTTRPERGKPGPVVVLPNGIRIEQLTMEELVTLTRGLA